ADGNVALGDPWALIEQPRGLQEWCEIDLDECAAEPLDQAQHLRETLLSLPISEKLELLDARDAKAAARDLRLFSPRCSPVAGERIRGIEPRRCLQHCERVSRCKGEDRDAVERLAGRHDATRAEQAASRLEADQVVERGRHSTRA